MGVPYTPEQLKKLGLIEVNGVYVKASSQVAKGKVEKLSLMGSGNHHLDAAIAIAATVSIYDAVVKNQKIKNATKAINEHGVKFDSLLEKYLYDLLTSANIYFEFQKQYLLQDKFRYRDEAVRAIILTVDFYLPTHNIIADSKGFQTQQGAMRWKMLKSVLKHIYDEQPEIVILKNKKECDAFVNRLLYGTT